MFFPGAQRSVVACEGFGEGRRDRFSGAKVDCRRRVVGRAGDFGPALGRGGESGVGGLNAHITDVMRICVAMLPVGDAKYFFFRALSGALCHAKGFERDDAIVLVRHARRRMEISRASYAFALP